MIAETDNNLLMKEGFSDENENGTNYFIIFHIFLPNASFVPLFSWTSSG